jgi:hypothetical protein
VKFLAFRGLGYTSLAFRGLGYTSLAFHSVTTESQQHREWLFGGLEFTGHSFVQAQVQAFLGNHDVAAATLNGIVNSLSSVRCDEF